MDAEPTGTTGAFGWTARGVTPVMVVDIVEPSVAFWTRRLGFVVTHEVPGEGVWEKTKASVSVRLARDGVELVYQTRVSVATGSREVAKRSFGHSVVLMLEVSSVAAVLRALGDWPLLVPMWRTGAGTAGCYVEEPAGNVVGFLGPE